MRSSCHVRIELVFNRLACEEETKVSKRLSFNFAKRLKIARETTNQTCFPFISYSYLIIDLSTKQQFHDNFFPRFSRGNLLLDRAVPDDFRPDNCLRSAG